MWEYCDPKDQRNTERLFTGSEHNNKQRIWLVAASMHVSYLGQKECYFTLL